MKVRIIKKFSKETGKFLGYALKVNVIPFVWNKYKEYAPNEEEQMEHDALWMFELANKVQRKNTYL